MLTKTGYGYKQLRLLRLNQDNFSVWAALDPNMQKSSDEGMIAEDLQQGLENLKLILEMPPSGLD